MSGGKPHRTMSCDAKEYAVRGEFVRFGQKIFSAHPTTRRGLGVVGFARN